MNDKSKEHYTLVGGRKLSSSQYNALAFSERLELVSLASGREKYELLLDAVDAERLMGKLPAQEVYLLLRELGREHAMELLPLLSPDQVTAIFDLDCWRGASFDGALAADWLQLIMSGGDEQILYMAQHLDFQLLVLILKKHVKVVRGPEDYLDDDARQEASQHFGGYELEFGDPEGAKAVSLFLEVLMRWDLEMCMGLLQAIRWEQETLLEEEVLQSRRGRLQDMGFPDPFEAVAVHAWLDPATFVVGEHRRAAGAPLEEGPPPGFVLSVPRPGQLLAEVLAAGLDVDTAWELTFLLNRVMIAERIDVGDATQVREALSEVCHTLELALEHLCGSDVEGARRLFAETYLLSLYQLGFNLTLLLQRRLRKVLRSVIAPYLDPPWRALADALQQRRPRFFAGIERPERGGERPFETLRDLRLAEEWLVQLEAQQRLFTTGLPFALPEPAALDLTGCLPARAVDLTLSDFLLTALGNRLLGRDFAPTPIGQGELPVLHGRVCTAGRLADGLLEETVAWLESLEAGAGAFGAYALRRWEEEFCPVPARELKAEVIGGLLLRLDGKEPA
jgi:hypothetical protein